MGNGGLPVRLIASVCFQKYNQDRLELLVPFLQLATGWGEAGPKHRNDAFFGPVWPAPEFLAQASAIPGPMRCKSGFKKRIFVINFVEVRYLADPAG
jgi:hypothetical protein